MLIDSHRHTASDLELWRDHERADRAHANSKMLWRNWRRAEQAAKDFVDAGMCWCGVSWGKDSVLTAHLAASLGVPLRWVRVEPIKSPECERVRDKFLRMRKCDYDEVEVWCERDGIDWHATGTLEAGVAQVESVLGNRVMLGIRATESPTRAMRVFRWGHNTLNRSAPIGYLTEQDVFALLHALGLPIHPAYAMLGGGRWPRKHLRVSSLGGKRGTGHGRAEWEREYYGDVLRRLETIP